MLIMSFSLSKSIDNFSNYFYKNVPAVENSNQETEEEKENDEEEGEIVENPINNKLVGCSAMSAHLILSMAAFAGAAVDVNNHHSPAQTTSSFFSQQQEQTSDDSETDDEFSSPALTISERAGGFMRRLFRSVNNVYLQEPIHEPIDQEDVYYVANKLKNDNTTTSDNNWVDDQKYDDQRPCSNSINNPTTTTTTT